MEQKHSMNHWQAWMNETNSCCERRVIFIDAPPAPNIAEAINDFKDKDPESADKKFDQIKIGDKDFDLLDNKNNNALRTDVFKQALEEIDSHANTTITSIFKNAYEGRDMDTNKAEQKRITNTMENIRAKALSVLAMEGQELPNERIDDYFQSYVNVFEKYKDAESSKEASARGMLDKQPNVKSIPSEVQEWANKNGYKINIPKPGKPGECTIDQPKGRPFKFKTGIKDLTPLWVEGEGKDSKKEVVGFVLLDGDGDVGKIDVNGASFVETNALRKARESENGECVVTIGKQSVYRFNAGKDGSWSVRGEDKGTNTFDFSSGKFTGDKVFDGEDSWENTDEGMKERTAAKERIDKLKINAELATPKKIEAIIAILTNPDGLKSLQKSTEKKEGEGEQAKKAEENSLAAHVESLFGVKDLATNAERNRAVEMLQEELKGILKDRDNYKKFPQGETDLTELLPENDRNDFFKSLAKTDDPLVNSLIDLVSVKTLILTNTGSRASLGIEIEGGQGFAKKFEILKNKVILSGISVSLDKLLSGYTRGKIESPSAKWIMIKSMEVALEKGPSITIHTHPERTITFNKNEAIINEEKIPYSSPEYQAKMKQYLQLTPEEQEKIAPKHISHWAEIGDDKFKIFGLDETVVIEESDNFNKQVTNKSGEKVNSEGEVTIKGVTYAYSTDLATGGGKAFFLEKNPNQSSTEKPKADPEKTQEKPRLDLKKSMIYFNSDEYAFLPVNKSLFDGIGIDEIVSVENGVLKGKKGIQLKNYSLDIEVDNEEKTVTVENLKRSGWRHLAQGAAHMLNAHERLTGKKDQR